jgi:hypothetical protein
MIAKQWLDGLTSPRDKAVNALAVAAGFWGSNVVPRGWSHWL